MVNFCCSRLLCLSIFVLIAKVSVSLQATSLLSRGKTFKPTNFHINRYDVMKTTNRNSRDDLVKVEFVQAAFAAGCALAVFNYVWNNIDEIKVSKLVLVYVYMYIHTCISIYRICILRKKTLRFFCW